MENSFLQDYKVIIGSESGDNRFAVTVRASGEEEAIDLGWDYCPEGSGLEVWNAYPLR